MLDTLPVFIGTLAPDGKILDANWLPLETFGVKLEQNQAAPSAADTVRRIRRDAWDT